MIKNCHTHSFKNEIKHFEVLKMLLYVCFISVNADSAL